MQPDDGFGAALSPAAIRHYSESWDDDGTWGGVLHLAQRYVEAQRHDAHSLETRLAWHHLLLAIGNFKRPAGRIHPGVSLPRQDNAETPEIVGIPVPPYALSREDESSWGELAYRVTGLGPSTTSTLLAALWPNNHAVIDRRALSAAIAVTALDEGWGAIPNEFQLEPEGTSYVPTTHRAYRWYLSKLRGTLAGVEYVRPQIRLWDIERTLYELDRLCARPGQTWQAYAESIAARLAPYHNDWGS